MDLLFVKLFEKYGLVYIQTKNNDVNGFVEIKTVFMKI